MASRVHCYDRIEVVLNLRDLAPLDPLAAEADEEAFTSLASLKHIGRRFPGEHATVRTGRVEFGGGDS